MAEEFLSDIKALTVLLLHLACQPGSDPLVTWSDAAREDHRRSPAGRGARWGLSPPAEPVLRGHALAAADQILSATGLEDAAQRLGPWVELTPRVPEGQLGWLADHTVMTPLLTRLIMSATSTRRRLSTLLSQQPPIDQRRIPQVLPAAYYDRHLASLLDVTDATGRLFASLCLARLGRTDMTWAGAAMALGLPADLGAKTARACSPDLLCTVPSYVTAIRKTATALSDGADQSGADFADRARAVRRLAATTRWYRTWARRCTPGARATSRTYAITWLWTHYTAGHITTSPGWTGAPIATDRANFRRYANRLDHDAREALIATVHAPSLPNRSRRRETPCPTTPSTRREPA